MANHYYSAEDLARFREIGKSAPDLAAKFFDWYGAVFADGALSAREKSIIALAVAHAVQCPYCIDAYSRDALEKGADLDQMTEAVHVAAAIRGGLRRTAIRHCRHSRDHRRPRTAADLLGAEAAGSCAGAVRANRKNVRARRHRRGQGRSRSRRSIERAIHCACARCPASDRRSQSRERHAAACSGRLSLRRFEARLVSAVAEVVVLGPELAARVRLVRHRGAARSAASRSPCRPAEPERPSTSGPGSAR